MFKWLTRPSAKSKTISDCELIFRLRSIAFAEGIPLKELIDKIEMPDGRMAMDWVSERRAVLKELTEFDLPDWPV